MTDRHITTTLNRIRAHDPCKDGWEKLLKYLGKTRSDDEPLPFSVILKSNGIGDALWCCRAEPQHEKEWRLFAVWCAVYEDFENLQECPAEFHVNPWTAISRLKERHPRSAIRAAKETGE